MKTCALTLHSTTSSSPLQHLAYKTVQLLPPKSHPYSKGISFSKPQQFFFFLTPVEFLFKVSPMHMVPFSRKTDILALFFCICELLPREPTSVHYHNDCHKKSFSLRVLKVAQQCSKNLLSYSKAQILLTGSLTSFCELSNVCTYNHLFYQVFRVYSEKQRGKKRSGREKASRPPSAQGFVVLLSAFFQCLCSSWYRRLTFKVDGIDLIHSPILIYHDSLINSLAT